MFTGTDGGSRVGAAGTQKLPDPLKEVASAQLQQTGPPGNMGQLWLDLPVLGERLEIWIFI